MASQSAKLRTLRVSILLVAALLPASLFYPTIAEHAHAASLLLRVEDSQSKSFASHFGAFAIVESRTSFPTANGLVAARLYTPVGISNAPGMVILHGVHHLGIEEPRLVAFARAFSASGVTVLTPELADIAGYKVTPEAIRTIGFSAKDLHQRIGHPVGVLGLSFSGGLALLAAADPTFADDFAYVVAVGAHHDMARVARFLATGQTQRPDGSTITMLPHEYGALLLVYSFVDQFFAPGDKANATEAIRLLLFEDVDGAKKKAAQLSPAGQERMNLLFARKRESVRKELLAAIDQHLEEFAAVSPHNHLSAIRVPVLLLHGTGDEVIPATESLWLAQEIQQSQLRTVLISPAITHVEVGGAPGVADKIELIHFMAEMLHEAKLTRSK